MSNNKRLAFILIFFSLLFGANAISAETHTINAEARRFVADIVYIQPGDTVGWINMTSHNSVSIDGLIPEGWLLNIAETNWKIDRKDRMSLLLALCNDCIGDVKIIEEIDDNR